MNRVSSAICQRYDSQIISSALSTNPPLQRVAVDILSSMARSGFIHPLSVLPTLIALTACPDPHFASKAYATLSLIYQKYASLCATRFAEPAKQSHMYMLAVAGANTIPQGKAFFAAKSWNILTSVYNRLSRRSPSITLQPMVQVSQDHYLSIGND